MNNFNFSKLQNGSDIRGVALPGVPGEEVNLTPEIVRSIASALTVWLCNKTRRNADELTIAIGHDSRLTGPEIKTVLERRLRSLGVRVLDVGMASTPAMFMSTVFPQFGCDAAVMITASHLPKNRNGFKFFTKNGGLEKSNIKEILSVAQGLYRTRKVDDDEIVPHHDTGSIVDKNLMMSYSDFLKDIIKKEVGEILSGDANQPLKGLHVVVDAGNGAGGFYATDVLQALGADISGSQYLEPDGEFPNHEPNPENKEAMESLKGAVIKSNADLGLIFDTDVDRSSAVDSQGNDISRNAIVALAASLISDDYPGTTVVTDSITSSGLTKFLTQDLGLKHHRYKRGYKNVINESVRLNEEGIDSQLAIETSGHAAFKENSFLDDGAYLATKIVIKTAQLKAKGKGIQELISNLKAPVEAEEFRFGILSEAFESYGDKILRELNSWTLSQPDLTLTEPNYEGVRIEFDDNSGVGWALLRKSLHDPIMVLNMESEVSGGIKKSGEKLMEFLSEYDMLDINKLVDYCR